MRPDEEDRLMELSKKMAGVKLGGVDGSAVRYPNVWEPQLSSEPIRLIIWPADQHIELLLALAEGWGGNNYYFLYVLLQGEPTGGRYQSRPLSFKAMSEFCRRFRQFLESDGRHHLWIGSTVGVGMLVYDHHNWIVGYGNLGAYTEVLSRRGFVQGYAELPDPHVHGYGANDESQQELLNYWQWKRFPLQEIDGH